jgi:PAS domain S-box-containing protein
MPNSDKPGGKPILTNTVQEERARLLSVIFDTIVDVTFVLSVEEDERYRFVFANKAFEKTTGLPPDKVVGRYVSEVIPEPSLSMVLAKYHEAVTTLARVVWLETSDYPTGRVTGEVSVTPVCDEAGHCRQLVGVVHDLTTEKQVEEELRRSNMRFAYALRATTDAIYEWNVADDTLYWGEGFEDLFGYRLAQNPTSFGKWADSVHPDDTQRVVVGLRRAAHEGNDLFWQEEYRFRRADGAWAVVFDRGYILRNAGGQAVRMIGAMQDVTARKQAEKQQLLLTEKLVGQNSDLQQFAYIVSHNLRAPLANALGFADLLSLLDKNSEAFDTSLQHLGASLRQLDQVLTDVNSILTLRDSQTGYRPEAVAIAEVCDQALMDMQEALRVCGGELVSALPPTLRLRGSRAYFHSIFHNLISNAIKYRSDARPLRVDIGTGVGADGEVTLLVGDNGSGFDQQKAGDEVFQLYRRFHAGNGGRGIGLYLVKTHVEAMGGHIEVQSRPGHGTLFTLYFRPSSDENLPN